MPARRQPAPPVDAPTPLERVMGREDASLLDVLDHVLGKGVLANGDLTLGVAGVDLIYVRLSALLAAVDRVMPEPPVSRPRTRKNRRPPRPRAASPRGKRR